VGRRGGGGDDFIERERRALIGGEEVPRIDTSERCAPWMLLWMDGCDAVLTRIDDVAKTRAREASSWANGPTGHRNGRWEFGERWQVAGDRALKEPTATDEAEGMRDGRILPSSGRLHQSNLELVKLIF
jgi:hypothetical protein